MCTHTPASSQESRKQSLVEEWTNYSLTLMKSLDSVAIAYPRAHHLMMTFIDLMN